MSIPNVLTLERPMLAPKTFLVYPIRPQILLLICLCRALEMTLAGLEPAIFGSEDQRLIH